MKVIELTKGHAAIVDDEDFEYLAQYRWHAKVKKSGAIYAARYIPSDRPKGGTLRMHREIMQATESQLIDHRNGNTLDNRRCNLRVATNGQNRANSKISKASKSGLKGVFRQKGKYRAYIKAGGKRRNLGYFKTPEEAHAAYCKAAIELHGEFARLN